MNSSDTFQYLSSCQEPPYTYPSSSLSFLSLSDSFSRTPVYYSLSIASTNDPYLKFLLTYDLSKEISLNLKPIMGDLKNMEKTIEIALNELLQRNENKILMIFDDLLDIELKTCEMFSKLELPFVIFSKDINQQKFEKEGCPLTCMNGILLNKKNKYDQYFKRIEKIPDKLKFQGYNFLVENLKFNDLFSYSDKKQVEARYLRMKQFSDGIAKIPDFLNEFSPQELERAKFDHNSMEEWVKIYEKYSNYEKQRNCTFDYYIKNYVLS